MAINKKQWFDVPDSRVKREDGRGLYYNVEARFSDHPVINVEKSKIARHNVYDFSIVCHTRVKRAAGDAPAIKNMTSQALRFDKGKALSKEGFEQAKSLIVRCLDAWEHYQLFREAPITEGERMALRQIGEMPLSSMGRVLVDDGGKLVSHQIDDGEEPDEDDDEGEQIVVVAAPQPQKRGGGGKKRKAA